MPNLGMHQTFAQLPDYDPETDQYNTANRHYSPMGRWMSPDPGGLKVVKLDDPQTWNMYAYVRNNPTTLTDPTGLAGNPAPSAPIDHGGLGTGMCDAVGDKECSVSGGTSEQALAQNNKQSPDPNLPVNNNYRMVVLNDSGKIVPETDTREVQYSLHSAPDSKNPTGAPVMSTNVDITEHLSNSYFKGSHEAGGIFQDTIGPHGNHWHATETTDRYFTGTVEGKQLGVVPVLDRSGTHVVDHIEVDFRNDRTKLNGTYEPTNVP